MLATLATCSTIVQGAAAIPTLLGEVRAALRKNAPGKDLLKKLDELPRLDKEYARYRQAATVLKAAEASCSVASQEISTLYSAKKFDEAVATALALLEQKSMSGLDRLYGSGDCPRGLNRAVEIAVRNRERFLKASSAGSNVDQVSGELLSSVFELRRKISEASGAITKAETGLVSDISGLLRAFGLQNVVRIQRGHLV